MSVCSGRVKLLKPPCVMGTRRCDGWDQRLKASAAAAHLAHFSWFSRRVLQTTQKRDFHTGGFTPHLALPVKTKQFRKCAAHSSPATQSHRKCTDEWKTIAAELGGFYCLATRQASTQQAGSWNTTTTTSTTTTTAGLRCQPGEQEIFSSNNAKSIGQ